MHRTQISLETEQYNRLGEEAQRRGMSLSALIRQLVDEHFGKQRSSKEDALEAIVGIGRGSGEPVGRDHNRHLYGKEDA